MLTLGICAVAVAFVAGYLAGWLDGLNENRRRR